MAMRQQGTGAQMLLDVLLTRAGASTRDLRRIATRAAARSAGLDFVPLLWENFDLAMRQRSYFRPTMQALIRFFSEKRLRQPAEELTGYDPSPAGQIRFAA
ncbi:molybdate-binding protein [Bradyrhizobium sp. LB8.2]